MTILRFALAMALLALAACGTPEKRSLVQDDDDRGFIREEYQL